MGTEDLSTSFFGLKGKILLAKYQRKVRIRSVQKREKITSVGYGPSIHFFGRDLYQAAVG
jgi:hypothetical protein